MTVLRAAPRTCILAAAALFGAVPAQAQESAAPGMLAVEATPVGALPPLALPMPASRNHNYWGVRLQAAHRADRSGDPLSSLAGGIDLQWRGGSAFGITGGYQQSDCESGDCEGHSMFGARARFNVITGGPTIGAMFGDYSATSTLGAEMGVGYAPDITPGINACTFDLGVPLSLAMLQRVRLVAYTMPSVVWDFDCGGGPAPLLTNWLMSFGIGVQQLGLRGLDVYLGLQKIFRDDTGYLFGVSVTYVRMP